MKKQHRQKMTVRVTPQTAYNLERLMQISGQKTPGRVVDKLVREKMLALRGHSGENGLTISLARSIRANWKSARIARGPWSVRTQNKGTQAVKNRKCEKCGALAAAGLPLCPACMEESGAAAEIVEAEEELRDIARVLSIEAGADANIRDAMKGILNIAERLERRK